MRRMRDGFPVKLRRRPLLALAGMAQRSQLFQFTIARSARFFEKDLQVAQGSRVALGGDGQMNQLATYLLIIRLSAQHALVEIKDLSFFLERLVDLLIERPRKIDARLEVIRRVLQIKLIVVYRVLQAAFFFGFSGLLFENARITLHLV